MRYSPVFSMGIEIEFESKSSLVFLQALVSRSVLVIKLSLSDFCYLIEVCSGCFDLCDLKSKYTVRVF
jgi:hypothetical protein